MTAAVVNAIPEYAAGSGQGARQVVFDHVAVVAAIRTRKVAIW